MTASEDIDNLVIVPPEKPLKMRAQPIMPCLLYTSDAADEL